MRLSLRTSIFLWIIVIVFLLLGAFSWLTLRVVRGTMFDALDSELATQAAALAAFCEWEEELGGPVFDEDDGGLALAAADEVDIRVLPGREILVSRGSRLAALRIADDGAYAREGSGATFRTIEVVGATLRVCRLRAHRPGETDPAGTKSPDLDVLIRVASSTADLEDRMTRIEIRVLDLVSAAFAALLLFGAFLSRRFTRPLADLERAAVAVKEGRIATMPRRGKGDELDRLAARLDEAFQGLGAALERQSRFTANAAHELRNPIAVIRSAAEVAARRERSPEEIRAFLADIVTTAERMGTIVEALLLLARVGGADELPLATVDLGELVADLVGALPESKRARVRVAAIPDAIVPGHAALLRVLVANLLDNAFVHGGDGPIEVAITGETSGIRLEVRDRGSGVASADAERIFEPFHRVDASTSGRDGAGLGLSIVIAIAERHGGEARVEDAEPGARFVVALPRAPRSP